MRRAWLVAGVVALLVLHASQELLEGALIADHPGGLAGVVGNGGWLAIPLSLAFGTLAALVLRVARVIEQQRAVIRLVLPPLGAPLRRSTRAATRQLRTRRRSGRRAGRAPPQLSI
jgi:hypothetical protein